MTIHYKISKIALILMGTRGQTAEEDGRERRRRTINKERERLVFKSWGEAEIAARDRHLGGGGGWGVQWPHSPRGEEGRIDNDSLQELHKLRSTAVSLKWY